MALRVVLGQQVSLKAARMHASRIVTQVGTPLKDPVGGLTHVFPTPGENAALDPEKLALPRARRTALLALADGTVEIGIGDQQDRALAQLNTIEGIGPWTRELIAMRALGNPDALPATDMGVKALGPPFGAATLTSYSQRRRSWRSYAVPYLWASHPHVINTWQEA